MLLYFLPVTFHGQEKIASFCPVALVFPAYTLIRVLSVPDFHGTRLLSLRTDALSSQYGKAGRRENRQIGVFLHYAASPGQRS